MGLDVNIKNITQNKWETIFNKTKVYIHVWCCCSKAWKMEFCHILHISSPNINQALNHLRLKYLTCDVTNYKMKHRSLTNTKKQKSKYTSSHCHERVVLFWFFQVIILFVDGVSNENWKMWTQRPNMCSIYRHSTIKNAFSSHYHQLVVITTH